LETKETETAVPARHKTEQLQFQDTEESGPFLPNPARGIARAVIICSVIWVFVVVMIVDWARL